MNRLSGIYFPFLFLQSKYTVPMVESMLNISVGEEMIRCGYVGIKGRCLPRQKIKQGKFRCRILMAISEHDKIYVGSS